MVAFYVWVQNKAYSLQICMINILSLIKNNEYLKRNIKKCITKQL